MRLKESKDLAEWARDIGVKCFKLYEVAGEKYIGEIEFFPKAKDAMPLDPKELAKVFSDGMPPDSKMLFASTEGIADDDENETPTSQQRENERMA